MRISDWSSDVCSSDLEMRDKQLPAMTAQLDQLVAQLRDEVNRVHNRGANTPFGQGTGATDPAAMYGSRSITTPTDPLTLGSDVPRSTERRVGKAYVSPCRYRWSPDH